MVMDLLLVNFKGMPQAKEFLQEICKMKKKSGQKNKQQKA